jgi:hypothetical protein
LFLLGLLVLYLETTLNSGRKLSVGQALPISPDTTPSRHDDATAIAQQRADALQVSRKILRGQTVQEGCVHRVHSCRRKPD